MSVFAIAQISIHDRERYGRYQSRFMGVFRKFEGRLLAADEAPQVLEGAWERDKVILMEFPDEPSFRAWAESPEYQKISKDRIAGTDGVVLLVRGLS